MDQCPYCKDQTSVMQFLTFKQCLNCGKTFDLSEKVKCPDCDGFGVITRGNDPQTERDCPYCKGTGKR